jgi:uncharacterized membrane protein
LSQETRRVPSRSTIGSGKRRKRLTLAERLRAYLIAGLLVTGPIALTFYLAWLFISAVDGWVARLIPDAYLPSTYLPFPIPGLGLVVVVVGLILIGALTAGYVGRLFLRLSDRLLTRMPFVRGIYGATKQIFETVLAKQSNTFREVVLVEFPRKEVWTIAFITGKTEGELAELAGDDAVTIYVPTTPNPTSGYLVFVKRRDVVLLSMTVEEAIKFIISGGIVSPPDRRNAVAEVIEPVPGE